MEFTSNSLYHIYNRGNNSQKVFFNYGNYLYFLKKIENQLLKHCELIAYCLMPNHFHLFIDTSDNLQEQAINKAIQNILSSYSQAINKQENRTGSLFQQHTKSRQLNANTLYGEICFHYIHQNPLHAGLVKEIQNWEFSSVKEYCNLKEKKLCNLNKARQLFDLPDTSDEFLKLSNMVISEEDIQVIL